MLKFHYASNNRASVARLLAYLNSYKLTPFFIANLANALYSNIEIKLYTSKYDIEFLESLRDIIIGGTITISTYPIKSRVQKCAHICGKGEEIVNYQISGHYKHFYYDSKRTDKFLVELMQTYSDCRFGNDINDDSRYKICQDCGNTGFTAQTQKYVTINVQNLEYSHIIARLLCDELCPDVARIIITLINQMQTLR
jgi:hypothetical protein